MKRIALVACLVVSAVFAAGCFPGGARISLERFGTIGFVGFQSSARGNITEYAEQVFLEVLMRSQPRVRIKELGRGDESFRDVRMGRLGPNEIEALARRYGVDAVFVGTLELSEARPRINLASILLGSVRASVEVDARMSARLLDARDGTTIWTDSARDKMDVANVSVFRGGDVIFDAQNPERAYGGLIRSLVLRTTRDFRR